MFQSMVEGRVTPWSLLVKDVPEEHHHDLDYIVDMLDWEANVDPEFVRNRYSEPVPARDPESMAEKGYSEKWIAYSSKQYSAKELTVFPGRDVEIEDAAAYGVILTQGHGRIGVHNVATPTMIRFGEMTEDELFVTAEAAKRGVRISNMSETEDLVMLKHFAPGNPAVARFQQ